MTSTQSTDVVAPVRSRVKGSSAWRRSACWRNADALLAELPVPVVENEQQATTGSGETDYINVETERQLVAVLDAHARQAREAVERALARIDDGTYGLCVRCGVPIDVERLLALPRVECCIDCQRFEER